MALKKESRFRTDQWRLRLRAALGVRKSASWCEADGCRVAWEEAGDFGGQAAVCLHDAGSGGREFRPFLRQRLIGIRLIVLDWPGHGRSGEDASEFSVERCARLLQAFVNQLGISRPVLLGHGFGAAVAIRFAAEHPARARGLVLSQPAGLFAPAWNPMGFWGNWSQKVSKDLRNQPTTPAKRQWARQHALRRATANQAHPNSIDLRQAQPGLRSALASLPCPILFAFSRESRSDPLKTYLALLDPLLKSAPQHRFTVFAGGFHPAWDEPERFAQAVSGFVQAQMPLELHHHAWLLTAVDWPTRAMNLWKCVHPECDVEQVLPEGQNANEAPVKV
jgi:pimeloyl-ACP methyl ester carboxylesterase